MEEQVKVDDQYEESAIDNNKLSKSAIEEETLNFLDSLDQYLILIDSLSNTLLRQGWLELAGARYSMGASRVNTALLNLQPHSAPTTVDVVTHDDDGYHMYKSARCNVPTTGCWENLAPMASWLCAVRPLAKPTTAPTRVYSAATEATQTMVEYGLVKLYFRRIAAMIKSQSFIFMLVGNLTDNKDSSLEKENIEEDEQLKENISSQRDSGKHTASLKRSNGSEINASPRKIENPLQKERAKVLSMFGTLVSPKLRASQVTFETALETLVEIANARSRILKSYEALHRDMKSTKE
ncbi:coiled-coil domain-containing protein 115 isoform X1 [Tanacetum coccineum]